MGLRPFTGLGEERGPRASSLRRSGSRAVPGEESGVRGHAPLMGEQVKLPVQLAHGDGLGVEHIVVDSLVHTPADGWLPFQQCHGRCQDSVTLGRQAPKSEPLGLSESRTGVGCGHRAQEVF